MKRVFFLICAFAILFSSQPLFAAKTANDYLSEGALKDGIGNFSKRLSQEKKNETAFSLATLHFFKGVETLAQSMYTYGLDSRIGQRVNLPFFRLPIPQNPAPKTVAYQDIRNILEQFYQDLEKTNQILREMGDDDFIVPLDIAKIKLDLNGNGAIEKDESFYTIYTTYNRRARSQGENSSSFPIYFDHGDAYWLKGYTHLLMALADFMLAHDASKVFDQTAHVLFASVDTKLAAVFPKNQQTQPFGMWADLISGIHVMNLDVKNPERLKTAHTHLLKVVESSRISWKLIEKEGDDAYEWIPNTKQTSVTGVTFSQEMITGWKDFLNEFEKILNGERLIPHWRIKDLRGINLKKVFYEPRPFDPVLWVQGSAALPYLENGLLSAPNTWNRFNRLFNGNFIGFAIWIN